MSRLYAHSLADSEPEAWELLQDHLVAVAGESARFGAVFGFGEIARVAGLLHDIGKASDAFQRYIADSDKSEAARGPDHSSAGAREAIALFGPKNGMGRLVAFAIAGHHAGLPDSDKLDERLAKPLEPYNGWEAHAGSLVGPFRPTRRLRINPEGGFTLAFLTRLIFSCLVDADRLKTGEFYGRAGGTWREPEPPTPAADLRDRLRAFMARTGADARARARTPNALRLAALRGEILAHAVAKAELPPGLFTLTVPTGGGKTLASLSFALEHAARHGKRRVVYVIPFTSIIEQTAAVFRRALAPEGSETSAGDILEHHATYDWEAALKAGSEDGRGAAPIEQLQRATENWDAPVIVTTAVQFYESLFANRPAACRKLHNLADAVVVLDEAQTLPLRILRPCLAALDELTLNYGASVVVCTATQPAWRKADGKLTERKGGRPGGPIFGLDIAPERELAPEPQRLFTELTRVAVERRPDPVGDAVIAERFAEQPQMLCIVNSRRHAKRLFDTVAALPGAVHLSTWMCPRHRRLVLDKARRDLVDGEPVRIVSTSLIEAGVDIDFPEVWRAATGLDSLLQAAGRCNREFRLAAGRLVMFEPEGDTWPHDLKQAWQAGRTVLRRHPDPQTLGAITAYFGELYGNAGSEALDASVLSVEGRREAFPILAAIRERADALSFPFAKIAQAFKVIEETMEPVIVPWSSGPSDDEADRLLRAIAAKDAPSRADLRKLQQYTVSIPKPRRDAWLASGVLRPVHPALGEALLRFDDLALYDPRSGLRVDEPAWRTPTTNIL